MMALLGVAAVSEWRYVIEKLLSAKMTVNQKSILAKTKWHDIFVHYMQPRDTTYVALNDGRKLCLECLDSAIMDSNECLPLYTDIQQFYEGLHMKVEQHVPLLLVERQALNEAREGEKNVRENALKVFNISYYCTVFLLGCQT